jgi:hypothetical protein
MIPPYILLILCYFLFHCPVAIRSTFNALNEGGGIAIRASAAGEDPKYGNRFALTRNPLASDLPN